MKVRINDQIICIPPHISARWSQISFIESQDDESSEKSILKLHLTNGKVISIPGLDQSIIDIVFQEHLRYLELTQAGAGEMKEDDKLSPLISIIQQITNGSSDAQFLYPNKAMTSSLFPNMINPIEAILQHTPEHKDQPDAPTDILEKMVDIIKSLSGNNPTLYPKPEPHCNCMHCQIGRAIKDEENETVTEEDLSFREWDIIQNGENLYLVTNPLDPKEQFSVYLGTPLGCTCGKSNCEHIEAVLYT